MGLLTIGALGGLLSGAFGVGGGILMVPLLVGFAGYDPRRASALSLAAIIPSAVVGTITYGLRSDVMVPAGLLLGLGGILGSLIGTRILARIPMQPLRWGFITLMIAVAVQLLVTTPVRGTSVELGLGGMAALAVFGIAVGIASGLFGIGGGVIAVPVLMGLFGYPDLLAKGTSLLAIIPTAATGTYRNTRTKLVQWRTGLIVGAAAAVASLGGVQLAYWLNPRAAQFLFVGLLALAIVQLTLKAISARRLGER